VHFLFGDLLSGDLEIKFRVVIIFTLLIFKLFYSVLSASVMLRSLNKWYVQTKIKLSFK
jgi:hypothetical protein